MSLAAPTKVRDNNVHPARSASVSAMPSRGHEDANLMLRVSQHRDRAALDKLVFHYGPRLKAWLIHRGEQAHTAEDIVQEAFIMIWTKADLFDPDRASFSTWAYRIARNKWIDHKRRHDRLMPTAPDAISDMADRPLESAEAEYSRNEASEAVRAQLALLPDEQKHILQLAFFEGLSHSEIANRTGLPLGTVKSRIRGSLQKMQTKLQNFAGVENE